ncbi:TRAP transporter small permease [Palleronia sp. LCG004]|uniref:TRAP transporter small permease n=1 Tax=Palleronia sp. LCG004 TaxID=3079304 RepID=UPI002942AFE7|nr:TRAP transporter small permease [Palleronia sp. LCG004]WOI57834.1 TRAP transporter small permease [Palleronia sp. LCG004]
MSAGSAPREQDAAGAASTEMPWALRWLDRLEEGISVVCLAIVLGAVSMQVIARYVFQAPLFWGDELARYSYVWMTFAAATFVTGRRSHVTIGLFDARLPERWLRLMEAFAQLIVAITCICLVVFSYSWLQRTAVPRSSALRMPMIYLYGSVWLAFGIMALHSLLHVFYVLSGRVAPVPPGVDAHE